ncbi:acyl-CoA N-acyltransferase [Nadsonia fulvescens var. elongata DSM 6958]|uniref:Acyl-CoA N-acyltransferase n=1 Tax=Nadsonia fulvescens var. elongata DSM 6958 TaxID=857566 RepID=A0A1E3PEG6_9ASCO|nr:acyl-CoA N-acyltransferase [Nadsonia fulvescens var. elongata DSM 6958]
MSSGDKDSSVKSTPKPIIYRPYFKENEETELKSVISLISSDLSEPYSIYVYRYFIYEWPNLTFLAFDEDDKTQSDPCGVVVCKLERFRGCRNRGYIAMLAVKKSHRGQGIAKKLVKMAVEAMINLNADEIMLETEVTNEAATHLYENFGFLRMKRLYRYYLNSNDAFRLILPVTKASPIMSQFLQKDPEYLEQQQLDYMTQQGQIL